MTVQPKTPQRFLKLPVDSGMIKLRGAGLDYDGEIHSGMDGCSVNAKILANPTLYPITADGVANLSTNADPQARISRTGSCDYREMGGVTTPPLPPDPGEFARGP